MTSINRKVNDTREQALKLAALLRGMLVHVNVIPLNPTSGFQGRATTREQATNFQAILEGKGIPCSIRTRRGIDIQAGCGQLAQQFPESQNNELRHIYSCAKIKQDLPFLCIATQVKLGGFTYFTNIPPCHN